MKIVEIDNILTKEELEKVEEELRDIVWDKNFTRAGSNMQESNNIDKLPVLRELYFKFSSPKFLRYLEEKFLVTGILPDPYLIGSGYSKIEKSNDLKFHIDFNWNRDIKLHRICSLIIYLSDVEGGDLEFDTGQIIRTSRNKAVIFEHSETVRHRVTECSAIRQAVRFFYYASKLSDPPEHHRSLYGLKEGKPVDL